MILKITFIDIYRSYYKDEMIVFFKNIIIIYENNNNI